MKKYLPVTDNIKISPYICTCNKSCKNGSGIYSCNAL